MKMFSLGYLISKLVSLRHRFKRFGKGAWIHHSAMIQGAANIEIGEDVVIGRNAMIYASDGAPIKIGARTVIHPYVLISADGGFVQIGEDCSINHFGVFHGSGGVKIGNGVRIAHNVAVVSSNHVFKDRQVPIRLQGVTSEGITIEDDVWIGGAAQIMDGITIGRGSVIGAGTVVTRSIPAYSVAVGVPARVIKNR